MRLLVKLTLAATLLIGAAAPNAGAALGRIVALGDSSATGTGLGAALPGTPAQCNRTGLGYPDRAVAQVEHTSYVNAACDGARTSSLFYESIDPPIIPEQVSALDGSEDVVILSIGDNNASYGEVTNNCLIHSATFDADTCADTYASESGNALVDLAAGIAVSQPYNPSIGSSIDQIRVRSPHAAIFLVGYPRIAPPDGLNCKGNYINLTPTDAPVFAQWEDTINQTLASEAAAHGAHFVDMHPSSLSHTACTPAGVRWVVPLGQFDPTAAGEGVGLHPNADGATAVATALVSAMEAAGLNLGPEETGPTDETGPTGPTGQTGGTGGADPHDQPTQPVTSPSLKILSVSPKIRLSARGGQFVRQRPRSGAAKLKLAINAESPVWIRLERRSVGRKIDGRCVAKARANRNRKTCTRWMASTRWLLMWLPPGSSTLYLVGHDKGKKLATGVYRADVTLDTTRRKQLHSSQFKIVE